jgi:hypothetical protein
MYTPLQYLKSTTGRLLSYAAVLAAVFGIAAVAGSVADPKTHKTAAAAHDGDDMEMSHEPAGLAIADDGHRLVVANPTLPAGRRQTLRFRILDDEGQPVREFEREHGAKLHLIIARRDLSGYQHLHPRLAADGTWSIPLTLPEAGAYRAYADFHSGGKALTLGADLLVPGDFQPRALPPAAEDASTDGYDVHLNQPGEGKLHFSVSRGGREVTDIQPYLDARGHLVALREGDLAYLHVHPEEGPTPGAGVSFEAEFPSAGRYRLYLQFKHAGRVHTAEFTREVTR